MCKPDKLKLWHYNRYPDMPDSSAFAHYFPYLCGALGGICALIRSRMSRRAENRRSAQLADFARSVGLQIAIQNDAGFRGTWFSNAGSARTRASILDKFYGFQPFLEGDKSPQVQNVMTGARDSLDWCMFDYSYEGSGRDKTEYRFAILAASVPFVFPKLTLEPENFLAKIGEHLGLRKLNFEVNEFNKRYCVTCSDEKRAYDILCPETIECLLAFPSRWWTAATLCSLSSTPKFLSASANGSPRWACSSGSTSGPSKWKIPIPARA